MKTHAPQPILPFTDDSLIVWPSGVAYRRGQGFRTRDIYLVNRGGHDDGTRIVRFHTNHTGLID